MNTASTLVTQRYVDDERDIAFYIVDKSRDVIVMTGATLSCKFTATGQTDVTTLVTFAAGDGRLHIVVTPAQVAAPIVWSMFITGTDGAGLDMEPLVGKLTVVAH